MVQNNEPRVIIGRLEPGFLKGLIHAERWRKFHREDPDATIDIYEEFDAAIEELNFLRDKLEAVKTHLTTWVSGHSDWQMGRMSQWKKELDEIVEDVDFDEGDI